MAHFGDADIHLETDPDGRRYCVVTRADEVIGVAYDLLDEVGQPVHQIEGGLSVDGDLISFGTESHGLGRLTYRIIERRDDVRFAVAVQVLP